MEHFSSLESALREHGFSHLEKIRSAYEFAKKAHHGQMRKTGEEYITHPVAVALLLLDIGADEESLIAAILHDTVEDTAIAFTDIEREFGTSIARLVDGVTKVEKFQFFNSPGDFKAANLRKMFSGALENERAILIKLADRAHNIQTLSTFSPQKQHRIAQETMELYHPLAKILGVWILKRAFENACFPILEPKKYEEITLLQNQYREKNAKKNNHLLKEIQKIFHDESIKTETQIHFKNAFGISEYSTRDHILSEDIHHFFRINVFVDSIEECYQVLGVLHQHFSYRFQEFRDSISIPKNNGYQSLHTSVFIDDELVQFHIQTHDMHLANEKCAFFLFPEKFPRENLNKTLQALDDNYYRSQEYLRDLQRDILQKKIFVTTKKGEKIVLPKRSTGIDFAYALSPDVGHRLKNLVVNGHASSPTTLLHNGDVIEAETGEKEGPKPHWVNHVKTALAKQEMMAWVSGLPPEKIRERGESFLRSELEKSGYEYDQEMTADIQKKACALLEKKKFIEVQSAIALSEINPKRIIAILLEERARKRGESFFFRISDSLVNFFYSAFYFLFTKYRQNKNSKIIKITIRAKDRPRMLFDLLGIIAKREINIASLKIYSLRPSFDALYKVWIEIEHIDDLHELFDEFLEVEGVKSLTK